MRFLIPRKIWFHERTLTIVICLLGAVSCYDFTHPYQYNYWKSYAKKKLLERQDDIGSIISNAIGGIDAGSAAVLGVVNTITSITNPEGRCTQPLPTATVPTPNAVSCQLGTIDSVGNDRYIVASPLASSAVTISTASVAGTNSPGIRVASTATALASANGANLFQVALSVGDFEQFRVNVLQTVDILDQKIRDILSSVETLSC